jgi:hypothetical protein
LPFTPKKIIAFLPPALQIVGSTFQAEASRVA